LLPKSRVILGPHEPGFAYLVIHALEFESGSGRIQQDMRIPDTPRWHFKEPGRMESLSLAFRELGAFPGTNPIGRSDVTILRVARDSLGIMGKHLRTRSHQSLRPDSCWGTIQRELASAWPTGGWCLIPPPNSVTAVHRARCPHSRQRDASRKCVVCAAAARGISHCPTVSGAFEPQMLFR